MADKRADEGPPNRPSHRWPLHSDDILNINLIIIIIMLILFYKSSCMYAPAVCTLSGRIGKVVASRAEGCKIKSPLWLSCTNLYCARGAQGLLPTRMEGATSQLDLPSLTPLSVAGCCRLQLGVPNLATSVDYCK